MSILGGGKADIGPRFAPIAIKRRHYGTSAKGMAKIKQIQEKRGIRCLDCIFNEKTQKMFISFIQARYTGGGAMKRTALSFCAVAACLAGSGIANAADLPVKAHAPVVVATPAYNWTGFYLGGHIGYGWGHTDVTNINGNPPFPAGTQSSSDQDGILGGLQGGYNWQFAPNWLIGFEGDYSWADISGDQSRYSTVTSPVNYTARRFNTANRKVDWTATATARLGYAWNNWLFYAKGGAAWAHAKSNSTTVNPAAGNIVLATTTGESTRTGWTVGGGVEWGFWNNWSAKIEYDYLDFGSETVNLAATYPGPVTGLNPLVRSVDSHISEIKFGVNYRFN
jgi:outer membrane immunogenic protein